MYVSLLDSCCQEKLFFFLSFSLILRFSICLYHLSCARQSHCPISSETLKDWLQLADAFCLLWNTSVLQAFDSTSFFASPCLCIFATWVTRSQRCNAVWIRGLLSFVFVNVIVLIHKVLGWECIVLWEGRCQLLNRPLIIANAQQQTFAAEALLCMQDLTSLVIRTNKLNQAFNCCLCICLHPFKSPCRICTHIKA